MKDLFEVLGIATKPKTGNRYGTASYNNDITNVFGKGFNCKEVKTDESSGLTIEREDGNAHFSDLNHRGFIKVTFEKDYSETRAFRFNKKEIRVIANYLNSILEDE